MELLQFEDYSIIGGALPLIDAGAIDPNTGMPLDDYGQVINPSTNNRCDDDVYVCNEPDRFGSYFKRFECLQAATSSQRLLQGPIIPLLAAGIIIGKQLKHLFTKCLALFAIALISVELPIVLPVFCLSVILSYEDTNRLLGVGLLVGVVAMVQLFIYLTGICDIISSAFNMVFNFALIILFGIHFMQASKVPFSDKAEPGLTRAGGNYEESIIDSSVNGDDDEPPELFTEYDN
jgi:hypothetical protein